MTQQIAPLCPTKFNRSELEWNNLLSACSSTFSYELNNTNCRLKIRPIKATRKLPSMHCVYLKAAQHSLWITLNHLPKSLKSQHPDVFSLIHSDSKAVKTMAVEILLAPIISRLEQATGFDITVIDYFRGKPKNNTPLAFSFLYQENTAAKYFGQIALNKGLKQPFYELLKQWPSTQSIASNAISINTRLNIGSTILSTAELKALGIGDVIIMDQNIYSEDKRMWALFAPNILITFRQETRTMADSDVENNLTELSVESIAEDTMPDYLSTDNLIQENSVPTESDPATQDQTFVDNLQIKLDFDLGNVSLSLAQIKQLKPGYIFSLQRPLTECVYICSNGKRLAKGELVDIDGIVGVKVNKLYKK